MQARLLAIVRWVSGASSPAGSASSRLWRPRALYISVAKLARAGELGRGRERVCLG
jgi:hypothetical protein